MLRRISILALSLVMAAFCIPASADTGTLFQLSATSATSCTMISPAARALLGFWNTSSSAQSVTVTFFADAGSCNAADTIFTAQLGASQVITFPLASGIFPQAGLSYTLSAACSNYIEGVYQ